MDLMMSMRISMDLAGRISNDSCSCESGIPERDCVAAGHERSLADNWGWV
jgi:hypothetical protein